MDPDPRRRLITTAVALLAAEGVEAVTLRRIARAAGVSHGAPLRHFNGRAELLSAVASEGFAELAEVTLPAGGAQARLLAACRAYIEFAQQNPAMFELMFRHDLIDTAALDQALFARFTTLVADAQATGWRPGAEPRTLAASLWAALHGLAELWLWGGLVDRDLPTTLDLTLEAYLG
ncbi:TetR/AcrR family transcriptional regulator [Amycolatopsis pithecellobii]|uniref:TetR family transcriptional regulator n=1 Tax=Amycolatopsis pithecellobii TaxID=664692 RepID=A0A6N7YP37_9PSEU|nr:TetR/AcrR family transcriptional regulator [Amycolatopsis pithecellobii]MTD54765.1 TetR family transcriptional regulator [Amycolatopsis pithecellobii]